MLTLAYEVRQGKCRTVVKTIVIEQSVDRLSDGCLTKIVDLRAAGHNPFFLDENGKRIKIRKRLPSVGVYAECTPVHRPGENGKTGKPERYHVKRKRTLKTESAEIKYSDLPTAKFVIGETTNTRRLIAYDFIIERTSYKLLKAVYDRLWARDIPCALIGDRGE